MVGCRALVFDLDDTLFPERDYVLGGFRRVAQWAAENLGIPAETGFGGLRALFEAGVRGDTFDRWLASHGLPPEEHVAELVRIYRQHEPVLEPFPGVEELLGSLRGRFRLGLLSDGHLDVQRRKLAATRLAPYFDAVVFSDEWGRDAWKPSTIPFAAILSRLEVRGAEAVYVGDNARKDFFGARRAQMHTVWLRLSGGEYSHLAPATAEHAADHTVTSFAELARLFASCAMPASRPLAFRC